MSTGSSTGAVLDPTDTPPCDPPNQYDPDSNVCYFVGTDITNNEIWRVSGLDRTDTSTAQTTFGRLIFPGGDNSGQDLQDVKGLLSSIDIDPAANMLYFVTQQINNGAGGATGGIFRYNLATNTYETLYTETNATDYAFKYINVVRGPTPRYYVSNDSFDDNNNLANTSSVLLRTLTAGAPAQFAVAGNINASVPWGLTTDNAPTLTLTQLGATPTYTEQAGSPSPTGAGVALIVSATTSDFDTTSQTHQLAGARRCASRVTSYRAMR